MLKEEGCWGVVGPSEGSATPCDAHGDIINFHGEERYDWNDERAEGVELVELVLGEELEGAEPGSFA